MGAWVRVELDGGRAGWIELDRLVPLGFARDGSPLSYATPRQVAMIDWLAETAWLVPVTARSRANALGIYAMGVTMDGKTGTPEAIDGRVVRSTPIRRRVPAADPLDMERMDRAAGDGRHRAERPAHAARSGAEWSRHAGGGGEVAMMSRLGATV